MAAAPIKTKTPGIYKRAAQYVFSYRVDGRQRWESCYFRPSLLLVDVDPKGTYVHLLGAEAPGGGL